MVLFLEQAESSSSIPASDDEFLKSNATIPVICYSLGGDALQQANKMLEVPCKITYKQLQEAIDARYNLPVQILYINNDDDQVQVDSDFVLK